MGARRASRTASAPTGEGRGLKIALYGGTFDPIHRGHVEPVLAAAEQLGLDRVFYVPTAEPPHKEGQERAPAWRRFTMVELATFDHPTLEVSAFEMDRRPAYTLDTVEHYLQVFAGDRLFLLLGADAFLALHSWHRGDELAAAVELVVLARPGFRLDREQLAAPQRRAADAGRVHTATNPPIAASATEIRRLLHAGETPPAGWLDPRVLEYARKYRLYTA